jgi:hypothetical protein
MGHAGGGESPRPAARYAELLAFGAHHLGLASQIVRTDRDHSARRSRPDWPISAGVSRHAATLTERRLWSSHSWPTWCGVYADT